MSFATSVVIFLLTVGAVILGIPSLLSYIGRTWGWLLKGKCAERRELIFAKVRGEERDFQWERSKATKTEDEDWERVESYATGTAGNGEKAEDEWEGIIGFFHPFCSAGGGGERVLWAAVKATQTRWPKAICIVYSGDHEVDKPAMLERVSSRFNIDLHPSSIVFIYLSLRHYVLSSTYSHFTLLGQSLGSLILAHEAFSLLVPDIYIDTMGYAFTLFFSKWLFPNVPTAAYVHYPTISTDMLSSLDDKTGTRGINSGAGVGWKGWAKKHYWNIFARLYSRCGRDIDIVMTNSSWTESHIKALWTPSRLAKHPKSPYSRPMILYPAVAVSSLESIPITTPRPQPAQLLYIAQFRPEKNHALILRAFAKYIHSLKSSSKSSPDPSTPSTPSPHNKLPQLILIGSIRSPSTSPDSTHIYSLRLLARELHLSDANLTFVTDAPWSLVQSYLSRATVGVNGMWNEHFGMGVVEYQAAGLIPVVHASGGPQKDIVIEIDTGSEKAGGSGRTGFHADDVDSFAAAFGKAISLSEEEKVAMRLRGRVSAKRFSDEAFMERWVGVMEKLVDISKGGRGRPRS